MWVTSLMPGMQVSIFNGFVDEIHNTATRYLAESRRLLQARPAAGSAQANHDNHQAISFHSRGNQGHHSRHHSRKISSSSNNQHMNHCSSNNHNSTHCTIDSNSNQQAFQQPLQQPVQAQPAAVATYSAFLPPPLPQPVQHGCGEIQLQQLQPVGVTFAMPSTPSAEWDTVGPAALGATGLQIPPPNHSGDTEGGLQDMTAEAARVHSDSHHHQGRILSLFPTFSLMTMLAHEVVALMNDYSMIIHESA